MKSLHELTKVEDPFFPRIREWVAESTHSCEILPPSAQRDQVLLEVQLPISTALGAVSYETGGLLVDGGWLRILGSGHPRLPRSLSAWNQDRADGFYLVADDAIGGFFAINTGGFSDDHGQIYYWAPDSIEWEALEVGYSDMINWATSDTLAQFYEELRWPSWRQDTEHLSTDECLFFAPPLWTKEGGLEKSLRKPVPVAEAFGVKWDLFMQLYDED